MKYNIWKFHPELRNTTGGWLLLTVMKAESEERAVKIAAKEFNTPKYTLKAYPHIDSMKEVRP